MMQHFVVRPNLRGTLSISPPNLRTAFTLSSCSAMSWFVGGPHMTSYPVRSRLTKYPQRSASRPTGRYSLCIRYTPAYWNISWLIQGKLRSQGAWRMMFCGRGELRQVRVTGPALGTREEGGCGSLTTKAVAS